MFIFMKLPPNRIFLFWAIIANIALALYLYKFVFSFYFFQDDWFDLNITRVTSVSDYLNFFKFRDNFIAWRPLALQNFFFLLQSIFGLNAFAYRILNFAILAFTYLLVVKAAYLFTGNKIAGLLAGGLWITSSIHFMNLAQINYNLIGTLFYTAAFIGFLKARYVFSFVLFLLALGSFELAVTWPALTAFYCWYIKETRAKTVAKKLFPYLLAAAIYMVARQIYVNPPKITEYEIAFNFDSIKAFFWYILWTFNVPEEFKKQIAKNLIIFEGIFLRDYWLLVFKSFVGVTAFVLLAAVLPFYKLVRNHRFNSQTAKLVVFGLVWFLTAISPVLLLPNHNFIMYLTLPSIGIFTAIACLLVLSKDKSLIILSVLISDNLP